MKLALGTVQFGLKYGLGNTKGKVSKDEVSEILSIAKSIGINTLDTAINYGCSEKVLGEIGIRDWRIVSKLPNIGPDILNIQEWIAAEVESSAIRLNVESLTGVLLHHSENLLGERGAEVYIALQNLKKRGLVEKIGVSIYSPDELTLLDAFNLDIVQAPLNVFDKRFVLSGWAKKLKDSGVEIHTRSSFLQGLLLMDKNNRPNKFNVWGDVWLKWDEWLKSRGISPVQACISYPLSISEVDCVMIGVDSVAHLEEIVANSSKEVLDYPDFGNLDLRLIEPSRWKYL